MTNVTGQEEQTIIYQAVERLVQKLWAANSGREAAMKTIHAERLERNTPAVTSRDLMDRIEVLEQQKADVAFENDTLRDYGRLKDNAKRQVEITRDKYREALNAATRERDKLLSVAQELEAARAQNTTQAQAYASLEKELHETRATQRAYAERVQRLEEILVLGRKGLAAEQW